MVDAIDNCLVKYNPDQTDADGDGQGDACDSDIDDDTIVNVLDNCPDTVNPGQENAVHPGTAEGDHCEDPDSDLVFDADDNCPDTVNPGQENAVHPGTAEGDHCEDPEPDLVFDIDDNCPDAVNSGQENFDGDDQGDACDSDDDNDGAADVSEGPCGGDQFNAAKIPERINGAFAGVDDDGDTEVDEALPPGSENYDCDGDRFTGNVEAFIFSAADTVDDQAPCAETPFLIDEADDRWPPDFDDNQVVNILDLGYLLPPYFGSTPGDPNYSVRRDLVPNGVINILDVGETLPPIFGHVCA